MLLCALYPAPYQNLNYFFDDIDKGLGVYSTYEGVALVGDFNAKVGEKSFDTFSYQHKLTSINRYPTCYKNSNNPSCIDHVLTNSPKSFFKTQIIFTGLSDFDKLVLYVFKLLFSKAKAKEISYRNLKRIILIKIFRKDFQPNL